MSKGRRFLLIGLRRQWLIMAAILLVGLLYALVMQWLLHSSVGYEYMLLTISCIVPAVVMALVIDEGLQLGVTRRDHWRISLVLTGLQGLLFATINLLATLVLRALHVQPYGMVLFVFNNQLWPTFVGGLFVGSLCGLLGISAWFLLQRNMSWGVTAIIMLVVILPIIISVPGMVLAREFARVSLPFLLSFVLLMFVLNVLVALLSHHLFKRYEPIGRIGKRA